MNGIVYSHISIELKTLKSEIILVRREDFFTVWVLWKCCSGEMVFSPLGHLKLDWREEQSGGIPNVCEHSSSAGSVPCAAEPALLCHLQQVCIFN